MIIPNGGFPPIIIINDKKNIKDKDNKNINIQKLIKTSKSLIDLKKGSLSDKTKIDDLEELDEL